MFAVGTLEAFGLYVVRTSALVISSPVLGEHMGFAGFKIALIAILSLLLFATTGEPLAEPVGPLTFGAMGLREVMIGVSMSFVLQATVMAVRVAGEFVGHEMAFSIANISDPVTGVNSPIVARMYETFFLLGLLIVNGHHLILRALSDSFERAQVGDLPIGDGMLELTQRMVVDMFSAGVAFAAPVLILLALVSVTIGLLARAVPQINIMEMGFTLRIVMGLAGMFAFAPLIAPGLNELYAYFAAALDEALLALER